MALMSHRTDPSQKIRARVNACAREGEKGLVNNYASPPMARQGWNAGTGVGMQTLTASSKRLGEVNVIHNMIMIFIVAAPTLHKFLGPWSAIVFYQTLLSPIAHAFARALITSEGSGHQTRWDYSYVLHIPLPYTPYLLYLRRL